jgi:predicted RNase H-like nuclease
MAWVAGADGCKGGWLRASRETRTGELRFDVQAKPVGLLRAPPIPRVLAIDIPIGLPQRGPRACDREARARLGPRRSSVFPAPIRPALRAASRAEASRITEQQDERRVSAQSFALYAKIRAVDTLLRSDPEARGRIREVHPELSFWAWNGRRALEAGKKTPAGHLERRRLAERWLGGAVLARARAACPRSDVADDDLLDAIAALWTATRIARGRARSLPADPPLDAAELRMEIVY